jgi:polyhydroxybutyrate depolymerase
MLRGYDVHRRPDSTTVESALEVLMRAVFMFLALLLIAPAALACGPGSDCVVGERHYRIAMPEGYEGPGRMPAIVYAHGYRGTARGVMRNSSLRRLASDLDAVLIAVNAAGPGWNLPNGPRTPDSDGAAEFAYFDAVLEDSTRRFPIDPSRIVAAGFSAGGMMTWNLACARPDRFAGFVPIAGTFWLSPPKTCARPVTSIIHIHGDADETVPLLGRRIGPTKQGEVPAAIEMYAAFGGFGEPKTNRYGGLTCNEMRNASGDRLDFCLFSGGHALRTEHLRHAWEQLRKAGQL